MGHRASQESSVGGCNQLRILRKGAMPRSLGLGFFACPPRHQQGKPDTARTVDLHHKSSGCTTTQSRRSFVVQSQPAFVNATRAFLVGELEFPFPARQTVVDVLEDVGHDPEVVSGCRRLGP